MELANLPVAGIGLAVLLVPLALEYADLRRSGGLSRAAALSTLALLVPAFAVGLAVGLPLTATPAAQWIVTVVTTLVLYSVATRVVLGGATPEPVHVRARRTR
jgi:hypothetical protein